MTASKAKPGSPDRKARQSRRQTESLAHTPTSPPSFAALPSTLRDDLISGLTAEISLDVPSFEIYGTIHALRAMASFTLTRYVPGIEGNAQLKAFVLGHGGTIETDYERVVIPVGYARLMLINLLEAETVLDYGDATGGDEHHLTSFALGYTGELHPDDYGSGSQAILIEDVTVRPEFRAHQIGLFATAAAMRPFIPGAAFAALTPMTPGTTDDVARAESRKRLTAYWAKLGFVAIGSNGDMLLDFTYALPSPYFDDPTEFF